MIYGNDERVEVAIIRALCATPCVFPRCRFAMNEFLVHFQDGHCLGKTVLRSFSRQMSLSEARVRLQACYPLRVPHLLNILHLTPMLPGR